MNAATVMRARTASREQPLETDPKLRVAIVGCGPRGLYCLERLTVKLEQLRPCRTQVRIFEPAEFPGAGNVYDPRQPAYLRMNFAAKHINAWVDDSSQDPRQLSFVDWLARTQRKERDPHAFLPRPLVGRYLHDCYCKVVARLQLVAEVTLERERVFRLSRSRKEWILGNGDTQWEADEVLLTVGHEGWRSREGERPVFPIERLSEQHLPPNSTVAVRGFALTWIDAALALTEGRGGRFTRREGRWYYRASGREPARLLPFSRSGRPMLAKPDETRFAQPRELYRLWKSGQRRIDGLTRPLHRTAVMNRLWQTIADAAAGALAIVSRSPARSPDAAAVTAWFDRWCRTEMDGDLALTTMQQSYAVATAQEEPDIAWAVGAAWRGLYPGLVRCVSHGGLSADAWPKFRQLAAELERIAFGPPAENVGRLLALVEAGLVELDFLNGTLSVDEGRAKLLSDGRQVRLDACLDAVLPAPRNCSQTGPLAGLFGEGIVRPMNGGGILVDEAGTPLIAGGDAMPGLAVLGRCTEGCVLGNDTLSRTLHDHPERWASRLVSRWHERLARS